MKLRILRWYPHELDLVEMGSSKQQVLSLRKILEKIHEKQEKLS